MPALRIQMHLHGNPGVLQRHVVNQRLFDTVHMVILRLHQKRGRRIGGDRNIRIQLKILIVVPQMSRIKAIAKSGRQLSLSAASTAGYKRLSKCVLIAVTICPPGRKADHANLVRINLPLGGVKAHQPHRPLRIFQRQR